MILSHECCTQGERERERERERGIARLLDMQGK